MSLTTPSETLRNGIATTTGIEPLVLDVSPIEAGELAERANAEPGWVGQLGAVDAGQPYS